MRIEELEKIPSQEEIRALLSCYDFEFNRNILQLACSSTDLKFHENLWAVFRKYFEPSEILEFINHVDVEGNHLLFNAANESGEEILKLSWDEIKSFMHQKEEIIEYLMKKGGQGMNLFEMCSGPWKIYLDKSFIEWIQGIENEYGLQVTTELTLEE